MIPHLRPALFSLATAFLIACNGGGGSDSDDGNSGTGNSAESAIETVIRSGDIFAVEDYDAKADLLNEAVNALQSSQSRGLDLLQGLYGNSPISYELNRRTSFVQYGSAAQEARHIIPILQTNGGNSHAIAGHYRREFGRYSLFGSAPPVVFDQGDNLGFETPFRRLVAWLLGDNPGAVTQLSNAVRLVIARTHNTSVIQSWFETHLPSATVVHCDDSTPLADCTIDADLLIVGKKGDSSLISGDVSEIDRLLRSNTPLLYLHTSLEHYTEASTAYSALFDANFPYAGNYFKNETVRNAVWPDVDSMISAIQEDAEALITTLGHIANADFSYDWNAGLSGGNVNTANVPGYSETFGRAAGWVRAHMNNLDKERRNIFTEPVEDYRLSRILALIGDRLRQDVTFPMDILTTNQSDFLASYFADHLVYNYREINPLQPDRGFHGTNDHSDITASNYQVDLSTRLYGRKPTGAYALPGRSFTLTRTDTNSDIPAWVYWNAQLSGGVFAFRSGNRYDQPKYLRSREIALDAGESITVTSPYGGVIHLRHGKAEDKTISLSFTGVGNHPFYNGPASTADFTAGLASEAYDWAEIATEDTYVTEPTATMKASVEALASRMNWDVEDIAAAGSEYYYNGTYSLSGYIGFDIPAHAGEVTAFCNDNNWECDNVNYHGISGSIEGNIRQTITNCGSMGGCSTQPVTYTWKWDPLGAGPVHERGHHLEGNSGASYHRFAPLDGHQLTNIWRSELPYRYYRETGNNGACNVHHSVHRNNGDRFQLLQNARNSGNTRQYMADNVWSTNQAGNMNRALITQFAAHAKNQGRFTEGWSFQPLYWILAREFSAKLKEGEAAFDAVKNRYGFSQYSHAEASALVSTAEGLRSWALIAYSLITGRDQRSYFDMWGFDYDEKASLQVASLLLAPAVAQFYAFDDICSIADAIAVPVDGVSAWPENRPTVY